MTEANHTTYYYDYITLAYVVTVMNCGLVCNAFMLFIFMTRKTYRLHIMAKYQVFNATLTVLDIVTCLVGMPLDIVFMMWLPAGSTVICHLTVAVVLTCAISCSITLVAISGVRYVSVAHPIHPAINDYSLTYVPVVIVSVSFLIALPYTFMFEKHSVMVQGGHSTEFCQVNLSVPESGRLYHLFYFFFLIMMFVCAFVTMSCNYLKLSRRVNIIFSTGPNRATQTAIYPRDIEIQPSAAKLEDQKAENFSRTAFCHNSRAADTGKNLSSDVEPTKVLALRVISEQCYDMTGEQCYDMNTLPVRSVLVESSVNGNGKSWSCDAGTLAASPRSAGGDKTAAPVSVVDPDNKIEGGGNDVSYMVDAKRVGSRPLDTRLTDYDDSSLCSEDVRKRALRITESLAALPRSECSASAQSSNACLGCFPTPCRRERQEARKPADSIKETTTFLDSTQSKDRLSVTGSYSCSAKEFPVPTHPSKRIKALRMLCLVVFEFMLCYLPYPIYMIVCYYLAPTCLSRTEVTLINLAMRTFYLQTVLTPIIYTLYNARFRRDLCSLLRKLTRYK